MATPYSIFNGAAAALADLKKLKISAPGTFAQALYQEAQIELTEIKKRTPVDTGALRASERVSQPIVDGKRIYVVISAGGLPSAAAPYAFFVHEDLEAFHKTGQAKYIESVLNESAPYLADRIARRIDANFTTTALF